MVNLLFNYLSFDDKSCLHDNFTFSSVELVPEEPEDMWHAYNLVAVGDTLRSTTIRLVDTL